MNTDKPVIVSDTSAATATTGVYADGQVATQRHVWVAEGIKPRYLEALAEELQDLLRKGYILRVAVRRLLVEVEDARRESLFDEHVDVLMQKFHLPRSTARGLIEIAKTHHHRNRRPRFEAAIAPVFAQVKRASLEAYLERRRQQAAANPTPGGQTAWPTMAEALVKSGVVR